MNQPQPLSGADAKYQAILHELMDMATDIARTVHKQATAQNPIDEPNHPAPNHPAPDQLPSQAPDPTIQFDRIARTIRRTIALARDLANPPRPPRTPAQTAIPDRTQARKRIIRRVEDSIRSETSGKREESLREELYDRMDAPDLEDDIATRPVEDIVRDLCNDLGLGLFPHKRRSPAEAHALAKAAAATGPIPRPPPRPNHPIPNQAAQRQADIDLMHKLLGNAPKNPARRPPPA